MSKTIKTRIQNKHDIPENWAKATFIPLPGELIIYDDHYFDTNGNKVVVADAVRYKIGDGVTTINELPFVEKPVDQVYSSESTNAQSGIAVKEAIDKSLDEYTKTIDLAKVAISGQFEDLFIGSDIIFCLDAGGADTQLALLDKTILL